MATLLSLFAALALASPEPTPAPPDTAGIEVSATLVDAAGQAVQTTRLAEPITLRVVLAGPPGTAFFPPFRPATPSFELLPAKAPEAGPPTPGRHVEIWRYELLPVRLGIERVAPIEIPWRLPDGTEGAASTPALRVDVRGRLENDGDPAPAPPPGPVPVVTTDWALIWGLSVGGALVVALLLSLLVLVALRARFRALAPPPPPRPAIDVALERLDTIAHDDALTGAARHAAIVDALRSYLAGRYEIDALEMTSRELRQAIRGLDLRGVPEVEIDALLDEADLVKYAGSAFDDAAARARLPRVREIVVATWEPPAPVDDDAAPRLASASLRQRLLAGAIDAALALLVGGALFAALWLGGELSHGWATLLVVGLLLALRDAPGRSLGKALLGLSVVGDGPRQALAPLTARLTRNALFWLWPVALPVEALTLAQHPLRVRVGDLLGHTVVVQGRPRGHAGGAR
jgi:uncharacterized RDD family membrane protein YckC